MAPGIPPGDKRSRGPAALTARAAVPLPAPRVSLSPVLPARVADPRPHRETGQAALVLSQFVLSGVFICQRYSGGARGGGGSRGQSRPCRHAAARGEAGTGEGARGGAVGVLQAQRVGGRVAAPGRGVPVSPPGGAGTERGSPGRPPLRPARPRLRSRTCTRVLGGPAMPPPALRGVRPGGAAPRLWASPGEGTAAGDRLRELGGRGGTGAMQGSAPRPALRRGT